MPAYAQARPSQEPRSVLTAGVGEHHPSPRRARLSASGVVPSAQIGRCSLRQVWLAPRTAGSRGVYCARSRGRRRLTLRLIREVLGKSGDAVVVYFPDILAYLLGSLEAPTARRYERHERAPRSSGSRHPT
jgi:hypothetical protein